MAARSRDSRLRSELEAFVAGPDRSPEAAARIHALLEPEMTVPMVDELAFVTRKYVPDSEEAGEGALLALAEEILAQWAVARPEPRWRLKIPDDAKGLDRRWLDAPGRERAVAVAAGLRTGKVAGLGFGEHDGRVDLRGLVVPEGRAPDWIADLDDVDLSGARLELMFTRRTIRNCRFDGISAPDAGFRLWSSTVEDSTFRGANLAEAVLAGVDRWPRHCTFLRIDFSGANLSYVDPKAAIFEDCDFSNARLHRAEFSCPLVRCRFSGHMHETMFYGSTRLSPQRGRLVDCDFSSADLHWVAFRSIDLTTVRLPVDPRLLVIPNWRCVLGRLKRLVAERDEPASFTTTFVLEEDTKWAPPGEGPGVLELDTLREHDTEQGVRQLERLIEAARHDCEATSRA